MKTKKQMICGCTGKCFGHPLSGPGSIAPMPLRRKTPKHVHHYKVGKSGKVKVCQCGRFQHIGNIEPVVEIPPCICGAYDHENGSCLNEPVTHTPTPWEYMGGQIIKQGYGPNGNIAIIAKADRTPGNGVPPVERDANMKFIEKAVNSHEKLAKLVKELSEIPLLSETPGVAKGAGWSEMDELICEAREVIAKTEVK